MGQTPGRANRRTPTHVAALVRDSRLGVEPQPARRARDARAREPLDDSDLYASRLSASCERLRSGPSAGAQTADRIARPTRTPDWLKIPPWVTSTARRSSACAATAEWRSAATAKSRSATKS